MTRHLEVLFARNGEEQIWGGNQEFSCGEDEEPKPKLHLMNFPTGSGGMC